MTSTPDLGFLYIATNTLYPGVIKGGFTKQHSVLSRIARIGGSTPDKWRREGSCKVISPRTAEKLLLARLGQLAPKLRGTKELFTVELQSALAVLEEVAGKYSVLENTCAEVRVPGYGAVSGDSPAAQALMALHLTYQGRSAQLAELLAQSLTADGPALARLKKLGLSRVNVGNNEGFFRLHQGACELLQMLSEQKDSASAQYLRENGLIKVTVAAP